MSRIGRKPVAVPKGVTVTVGSDGVDDCKRTERRIEASC